MQKVPNLEIKNLLRTFAIASNETWGIKALRK